MFICASGKVQAGGAKMEVTVGETVGMAVSVSATCVGKSGGRGVDVTTARDGNPTGGVIVADDGATGVTASPATCEFDPVMILLAKSSEKIKTTPTTNKPLLIMRGCFILGSLTLLFGRWGDDFILSPDYLTLLNFARQEVTQASIANSMEPP
jgi:hypothetical protein